MGLKKALSQLGRKGLKFPYHSNQFNACKSALSTEEALEPKHWFGYPFDQSMISPSRPTTR